MKIVLAGMGAVGFHLAELLAKENQTTTVIDTDIDILDKIGKQVDVYAIKGDATSIDILKQAEVGRADLFIAVTNSEKTNLLSAIIAKQLGVKKTIARIGNPEFLDEEHLQKFEQLGIDTMISPQMLATEEIDRLLTNSTFSDIYDFDGILSVVGLRVSRRGPMANRTITDLNILLKQNELPVRAIALLRGHETIIPKGDVKPRYGDHIYFSVAKGDIDRLLEVIGAKAKPIKKVMMIGATDLTLYTASQLENKYDLTIIVNDKVRSMEFAEQLHEALIINADPTDMDMLREEGLEHMDAFIALTPSAETNIIACLTAEEMSEKRTIALVDNVTFTHISQNIGIDTIINKKLILANNIFRFVRKGNIEAIATLHGVNAEVIEFNIHKNNRLLKMPICDFKMPEKSIVAGIVRDGKSYIPNPDFRLNLGDKVIILALPEAIPVIENIFK